MTKIETDAIIADDGVLTGNLMLKTTTGISIHDFLSGLTRKEAKGLKKRIEVELKCKTIHWRKP